MADLHCHLAIKHHDSQICAKDRNKANADMCYEGIVAEIQAEFRKIDIELKSELCTDQIFDPIRDRVRAAFKNTPAKNLLDDFKAYSSQQILVGTAATTPTKVSVPGSPSLMQPHGIVAASASSQVPLTHDFLVQIYHRIKDELPLADCFKTDMEKSKLELENMWKLARNRLKNGFLSSNDAADIANQIRIFVVNMDRRQVGVPCFDMKFDPIMQKVLNAFRAPDGQLLDVIRYFAATDIMASNLKIDFAKILNSMTNHLEHARCSKRYVNNIISEMRKYQVEAASCAERFNVHYCYRSVGSNIRLLFANDGNKFQSDCLDIKFDGIIYDAEKGLNTCGEDDLIASVKAFGGM